MSSQAAVLTARGLRKSYGKGEQRLEVLAGIDLDIAVGERVSIIGPSGSGKSTLLHVLGGLDQPDAGEVRLGGRPLFEIDEAERSSLRNRSLGFVYQFHHLLAEFSAVENVAMPLLIGGDRPAAAREKAESLLEQVGLGNRRRHRPGELSGGERQRVSIARALAMNPQAVLADEPTGNLDEKNAAAVGDLMLQLSDEHGIAFVVATHNSAFAWKLDRVFSMHGGLLQRESAAAGTADGGRAGVFVEARAQ